MQLSIVAVGKMRESYYRAAVDDYCERIKRFLPITETEVSTGTGDESNGHGRAALLREAEHLQKPLQKPGVVVALHVTGKSLSTIQFSDWLQLQMVSSIERVSFVIGGAWGLSPIILERADLQLSLSAMTLPHELARVVLVEQIYRALTLWKNLPYHK